MTKIRDAKLKNNIHYSSSSS